MFIWGVYFLYAGFQVVGNKLIQFKYYAGGGKKKDPCRNRGRLPKLTAYEKNLNFIFYCSKPNKANAVPIHLNALLINL
jgi:hypothetical protein